MRHGCIYTSEFQFAETMSFIGVTHRNMSEELLEQSDSETVTSVNLTSSWMATIKSVQFLAQRPVSCTKKKTNSKWFAFCTQHSLRSRSLLPGSVVSHVNRILNSLNRFFRSLKWLKIICQWKIQSWCT